MIWFIIKCSSSICNISMFSKYELTYEGIEAHTVEQSQGTLISVVYFDICILTGLDIKRMPYSRFK